MVNEKKSGGKGGFKMFGLSDCRNGAVSHKWPGEGTGGAVWGGDSQRLRAVLIRDGSWSSKWRKTLELMI